MDEVLEIRGDRSALLRLAGDLGLGSAHELFDELHELAAREDIDHLELDLSGVHRLGASVVSVICRARVRFEAAGKELTVGPLAPRHRAVFDLAPHLEPSAPPPRPGPLESLGATGLRVGAEIRELGLLVVDVLRVTAGVASRRLRLPRGSVSFHAAEFGIAAIPIVVLLGALLGLILALQAMMQLEQYGAGIYVADLVGLSMAREFAPLLTAIVVAGRSGAAIASELGTMKVNQEIDALRAMGIDTTRFLVAPRLFALIGVQPALTLIALGAGLGGGWLAVAAIEPGAAAVYGSRLIIALDAIDVFYGLGKSTVLAAAIAVVGCAYGHAARGGAGAVGRATTRAVVTMIVLIVVIDFAFAVLRSVIL
jgi:phospholipid/cholesterol/gamma-HCH transport system permease protein